MAVNMEAAQKSQNAVERRFDPKYTISESAHIDDLPDCAHFEIGSLISQDAESGRRNSCWRILGSNLGVDTAAIGDSLAAGRTQNPGYDVIRAWKVGRRSTIRALRLALGSIKRDDVVALVDKFRCETVLLTITLMFEGDETHDLSGQCPGKMQLVDYVRPLIRRKLSSELILKHRSAPIVIQMRRAGLDSRLTWASEARRFRGKDLIMEKIVAPRKERSERARTGRGQPVALVDRLVVCSESDVNFYFAIADDSTDDDDDEEEGPPPPPSTSSSRSGSLHDVDHAIPAIPATVQDYDDLHFPVAAAEDVARAAAAAAAAAEMELVAGEGEGNGAVMVVEVRGLQIGASSSSSDGVDEVDAAGRDRTEETVQQSEA